MTSKPAISAALATVLLVFAASTAPAHANQQREQAQANFLQADVNQDQHLDLAEFTTFINLNADDNLGRAARIRRLGLHGRAFARLDANRDGLVSREELVAQLQR